MADSHAMSSQPDPATPGLMRLPAELRVTIYRMVFANMHSPYLNQRQPIVHVRPDTQDHDAIYRYKMKKSCYMLLSTCRLIHAEAVSIFWGEILVHLDLEPSFFAPGTANPYDPEVLGNWIVRSGIRSIRSRRKVKTLSFRAWSPDECLVWKHCIDWWRTDCSKDPSVAGLDGFENVTNLNVELSHDATHWSGFPSKTICDTIVAGLPGPDWDNALSILDCVTSFRESTVLTLDYLLPRLPKVKAITLSGYSDPAFVGLTWFGFVLQPLPAENYLLQKIRAVASKHGCEVVVNMNEVQGPGCFLCGIPWALGHWSPTNPAGDCIYKDDADVSHTANEQRGDLYVSKWEHELPGDLFLSTSY
ncbi:hypothetical protein LTR56_012041 [Elasticomyces elasticus]|nr:hypothetical protein LTR56_012041 [Elasticomyces elasticus]KAK3651791.1 hypothetical protein LTR22_011960 [Elasticomyces elasticus]KAK4930149.1 hypothetical protein LTR49_003182 [Elasticomyces elasticus]KAK5752486.1 hypothetical protein LTS12_017423 [Elasticomyces elasticus]